MYVYLITRYEIVIQKYIIKPAIMRSMSRGSLQGSSSIIGGSKKSFDFMVTDPLLFGLARNVLKENVPLIFRPRPRSSTICVDKKDSKTHVFL